MFKLVSRKQEKITPKRAKQMLEEIPALAQQRAITARRVRFIREQIRAGIFRGNEICVAENGTGERFLINGNHTLNACVDENVGFLATLTEYKCPAHQDLAELYLTFDNPWTGRNQGDMCRVYADALGLGWPNKIQDMLVGAIRLIDPKALNMQTSEKVKLMENYIPEGTFLMAMFVDGAGKVFGESKHMQRAPVAAAMIKTFQKCQRDALAFWTAVRDGELLERNDPQYKLREFLLRRKSKRETGVMLAPVRPEEIIYRSIIAWNAFRSGEERKTLKWNPSKDHPSLK